VPLGLRFAAPVSRRRQAKELRGKLDAAEAAQESLTGQLREAQGAAEDAARRAAAAEQRLGEVEARAQEAAAEASAVLRRADRWGNWMPGIREGLQGCRWNCGCQVLHGVHAWD
jgi:predicted  nucleic acid-binding Zn-ribbon protein